MCLLSATALRINETEIFHNCVYRTESKTVKPKSVMPANADIQETQIPAESPDSRIIGNDGIGDRCFHCFDFRFVSQVKAGRAAEENKS